MMPAPADKLFYNDTMGPARPSIIVMLSSPRGWSAVFLRCLRRAPRLEMWEPCTLLERESAQPVDHMMAMYPNGPDTMEGQLWSNNNTGDNSHNSITPFPVTIQTSGCRRQLEFALPAQGPP